MTIPDLYPMKKPVKISRKAIKEGLGQMPIDTLLLGTVAAKESRLTPKQREFARQLALGETKAGAYRNAYNSKGNPKTAHSRGAELARQGRIQAQADAFKVALEAQRLSTPAHLRALVVQQLTEKALDPDVGHSQQIRALELLGKITEVSLFTERREIVHTRPADEIREKLLESIRSAIKNGAEDAEVKDADSLLSEISNLSSDNVTNAGEDSHIINDNVTDSHISTDNVTPDDVAMSGEDAGAEAGATDADSEVAADPPAGHPPVGV